MNLKQLSGGKSRRVSDATSKGIKLPNTNLWFYGTKWDINGNTVAVFSFDKNGGRKWSVQVNAYDAFRGLHLPSNSTPVDIINANSKESIEKAVVKYINEFGTKMQKNGLFVEPNYVSDSRRINDSVDFITLCEELEQVFGGCDVRDNKIQVYVNDKIVNVELSIDQVAYIYTNSARTANDVVDVDRSEFIDDDSFINAVIDNVRSTGVYSR